MGSSRDKLNLRDNVKATFGDSDDLEIYHYPSNNNNYIQANNGRNLFIESNGISLRSQSGENMITATGDGAVALHYDAASHLQTTITGVNITGDLSVDNVDFPNSGKARFGASDQLQIYHDGSNNAYIENSTSYLVLESDNIILRNPEGTEDYAKFFENGAVQLYYDNSQKFATTSTGATITGNLSASSLTVDGSPQAGEVRFTRSGINNSTYTMLCTVVGNNYASIIDMTITGVSSNVVVNSSFEILVNHYQDIHVKSVSGDYIEITLRITSDDNEDFSIEAKHNGSTTTSVEVCIFPRSGETITPTTTDPNYTGTEYVHTATEGFRFGGTDGTTESSNLIVDGRIGIGTASPTDTLEVQNFAGNPMMHLRPNAASTALNPVILYRNSLTGSANYMLCEGVSTFFGTHNGGVPTDKSEMIRLLPSSADAPSIRIGDSGSAGANLQIGNTVRIYDNGDSYFSGGDVGIGTLSPAARLQVSNGASGFSGTYNARTTAIIESDNSSGTALSIMGKNTGNSAIFFGDQDGETVGQVFYNNPSNYLAFGASGATRAVLNGTGLALGLNHTDPTVNLDIEGASNVIVDLVTTTANANTTIRFRDGSSTETNKATIGYDGTNDGLILTTGGFSAGNGIFIDDNQNVGIGTSSPQHELDVDGTIRSTHNIVSNQNYTALTIGSDRTNNDYGGLNKDYWKVVLRTRGSSTTGEAASHHYGDLVWSAVDGTDTTFHERLVMRAGGNIGIGVSVPPQKLSVKGTFVHLNDSDVQVVGITNASGHGRIYAKGSDGVTDVLLDAGGVSYLNGGNVGIGTTSPSNLFNVVGSSALQTSVVKITRSHSSASNDTYTLDVDSSSHTSNMTLGGAFSVKVNSGKAFKINGHGDIFQNYINYTDESNYEALKISAVSDHIEFNTESIGSYASNERRMEFHIGGTKECQITNAGVWTLGSFYISGTGSLRNLGDHLYLTTSTQTNNDIIFKPANTEAVRITGDGNLGIGTTSPNRDLNVVGQIGIDNSASSPTGGMLITPDGNSNKIYSRTANNVGTAHPLDFYTGSTHTVRIDTSGRVGIGYTSMIKELMVNGSVLIKNNGGFLQYDAQGNVATLLNLTTANTLDIGQSSHVDDMHFNIEGTADAMILNSTGLGIGAVPESKVHIQNTVAAGSDNFALHLQNTTTASDSRVGMMFRVNNNTGSNIDGAAIQAINNGVNGEANLTFGTVLNGTFDEHVRIDSGGKVGIGKEPSVDLDVNGNIKASQVGVTNIVTNKIVKFAGTYLDDSSLTDTGSVVTCGANLVVNGELNVDSGTLYVDPSGDKVGIGTTSPTNKLHVAGDLKLETVQTSSSNRVLVWDSISEVRYKDISTADQTYNGDITFNGTTSESDNNGTRFTNTNYVQFEGQPMSRLYGNECLWVDRHGSVSTSGTIIGANNVFRTGDNYCQFSSTTGTDNPIVYTIDKTFLATTAVNNRRICIFAHVGFTCDLKIEVKNSSGTYETVFDASHTFSSGRWSFFRHDPEITYPADWSIQGLRFTFDNYGTTTRYIGQIGITNIRNHNTFPYIARGGGNLYDDSVLSFGNGEDLQIFHDGSNSYIRDNGTGGLVLEGSTLLELKSRGGEVYFRGTENGMAKLYYDNAGKLETTSSGVYVIGSLGVGTSSPAEKLHVFNGSIDTRGSNVENSTVQLYFDANNGSGSTSNNLGTGITWKSTYSGYSKRSAGILQIGEGNYFRSGLAFFTNNTANQSTDWSERMRIDMDGNVGIGASSPDSLLHLQSASATGAVINLETTHSSGIPIYNLKGAHSAQLRYQDENGNNQSRIDFLDGGDFNFIDATDGTSHLKINSNGNVGIGTTSPATKLVIDNGGVGTVDSGYSLAILGDGIDGVQIISSSSHQGRIVFGDNSSNAIGRLNYDHSNDSMSFVTNGSEKMRIASDGKVGIGTASPVAKLDVDGQIDSQNRKHKHYSSLTGSSGDWFPLMQISDAHGGSVLFNINTFAHNSCTFIVSDGYGPSGGTGNPAHISVLNYLHNTNGGYANITGIRVNQVGMVEIRLTWGSGPSVNIDVTAETSELIEYDFASSLATSTSTESIRDTALLEGQRARFKKLEVDDRLFTSIGSATAPAICFTDDPDTGIYGATNNHLHITTGSAVRATFNSSGISSASNVYSGTNGQFRNYAGVWKATTGTTGNGFQFISADATAMVLSSTGSLDVTNNLTANSFIQDGNTGSTFYAARFGRSNLSESNPDMYGEGDTLILGADSDQPTLVIRDTENVGIGTASPAEKLEVAGNIAVRNGTYPTQIELYESFTDGSNYERTQLKFANGYFTINPQETGTGVQSGIDLAIGGTSKLKIEPEGHVLINGAEDNSNTADFAVKTGAIPQVSWRNDQVQIGSSDMNWEGKLFEVDGMFQMASWSRHMRFFTQSNTSNAYDILWDTWDGSSVTTKMRLKGDGKLGIGTQSPSVLLDIYNGAGWGGLDLDGTSGGELRLQKAGTTYLDIYASDAGSTGSVIKAQSSLQLSSNNSTAANRSIYLNSSGNVGIGTTSPSEKLHVVGSKVRLDTNAGGYYGHNASGSFRYALYDNNSVTRLYGDGNGSNAALEIDSNKVGLGCAATANSKASVFIKGEDNSPTLNGTAVDDATLILTNSFTTDPYGLCFGVNTSGTSLVQSRRLGSETYFKLALNPYGGNVGIGTDSPNQELEVDGVIKQKVYTVSTLPTAGSSTIGARAFVSDSYYAFSSSYLGSQISGGGSNFSPVYSDGSYWYMG